MRARYFDSHFDMVTDTVPFQEEWANGTSYFDGAVHDLELPPGKCVKSIDPHGRRIILIGTRFGNIVLFERYCRDDDLQKEIIVVSNTPRELRRLVTSGSLSYDEFARIANPVTNMGIAIEYLF